MGAIEMRVAAEVRSRWRASVALAAVIAGALGVVLAAAAGARRTQTAYPRFPRASNSADVLISPLGTGLHGLSERVRKLPEVEDMAVGAGVPMALVGPHDRLFTAFNTLPPEQCQSLRPTPPSDIASYRRVVAAPIVLLAAGVAIPVALALANLIAALPGRNAARTRPALVLRTE
jgi:hypothetical protein